MAKVLTPEEEEVLRAERDDLLAQSTAFFEEDDYELLPELFTQIAEVSYKLGERELADGFKRKAEEIRALFMSQDAPLEPEVLAPTSPKGPPKIPSARSEQVPLPPSGGVRPVSQLSLEIGAFRAPSQPPPKMPPERGSPTPPAASLPSIEPSVSVQSIPQLASLAAKIAPAPPHREAPSRKPRDALTEKIEKLKNLLNSIPTSELIAPAPKIEINVPSIPVNEPQVIAPTTIEPVPAETPPVTAPSTKPASAEEAPFALFVKSLPTKQTPVIPYKPPPSMEIPPHAEPPLIAPDYEPPLIAPDDEPPLIAPDDEPPLIAPDNEPPLVAPEEEPAVMAPTTEELLDILGPAPPKPVTTDELLDILGPKPAKSSSIQPFVAPIAAEPPVTPPSPVPSPMAPPPINNPTPPSAPNTAEAQELISERRTEQGEALQSGIVPKIVKSEEEVVQEILSEKLPLLPEEVKQKAIEKILTYTPGAAREAWLKVFLIKNKQYAKK